MVAPNGRYVGAWFPVVKWTTKHDVYERNVMF